MDDSPDALAPLASRELAEDSKQEILDHQMPITTLSRKLNTTSPVFRLPEEMLREIFVHLIDSLVKGLSARRFYGQPSRPSKDRERKEDGDNGDTENDVQDKEHCCHVRTLLPIVLTHVCYKWRTIALSFPALWTVLDTEVYKHVDILQLYLARSQCALLDLFLSSEITYEDIGYDHLLENLNLILQQSSRIRSMNLELSPDILFDAFHCDDTVYPFTHLESLDICVLVNGELSLDILPYIIRLDADPDEVQHSLRRIVLRHVLVDWPALISLPPTITHLDFAFCESQFGNMNDILAVLNKLPDLEVFRNKASLPVSQDVPEDSPLNVHLPHLKELRIEEPYIDDLFGHITYSALTSLQLDVKVDADAIPAFCSDFFSKILPPSPDEPWTLATITFHEKHRVELNLCTKACDCQLFVDSHRIHLSVEPIGELAGFDVWQCIFDATPPTLFSHVKQFAISDDMRWPYGNYKIPEALLSSLLKAMPCVEHVEVVEPAIFKVLSDFSDSAMITPNLQGLILINIAIVEEVEINDSLQVSVDEVCRCLEDRSARGSNLITLEVLAHTQLKVSGEGRKRLRDVVAQLSSKCRCKTAVAE
ncbi:hypothetical protein QCA50_005071 [Cerrena zonata]|uniref:F-box domain-containing protein n=1 Tax=Cerrena zonata TaxID=2478898 RepID=A0AAW0GGB9_9APHY